MVSPSVGWALRWTSDPGSAADPTLAPARSTDGGRTWADVTPAAARPLLTPTQTEALLVAAGATRAWLAVTRSGPSPVTVIFSTASGGQNWTRSAPIRGSGSVTGIAFPGRLTGWLLLNLGNAMASVNPVRIYRSGDGGRAWSPVSGTPPGPAPGTSSSGLPLYCQKMAITFVTATTGWLNGTCDNIGDVLLVTRDGGRHWSPQPLGVPGTACQAITCQVSAPQFFGRTGFLTIGRSSGSGYFLVSHDAGASWNAVSLPAGAGASPGIQFFDDHSGLLRPAGPGSDGRLFYVTVTAGATWIPVRQGRSFPQPGAMFDFVTTRVGFAWRLGADAGSRPPVLYRTHDSGQIWVPVRP
jgi:photosystem II stability/assembly factor-like uncharacterized protein